MNTRALKVGVLLALASLHLCTGIASADKPGLKLSHLNFGSVPVTTLTGTITATNRGHEPVRITGWSLSVLTPNLGIGDVDRLHRECYPPLVPPRPTVTLQPGESCVQEIQLVPSAAGKHRAAFCLEGLVVGGQGGGTVCTIIKARVKALSQQKA
jgi:hypothetical protein